MRATLVPGPSLSPKLYWERNRHRLLLNPVPDGHLNASTSRNDSAPRGYSSINTLPTLCSSSPPSHSSHSIQTT
ncbi:hypothetical protein RJT34_04174 [Clitoria ternatea]|uniref:Uncharacterized protein n=1 Tax=Clitoria ternatea TaxID=43366 RepID=A0AAN9KNM1_CLITE